MSACKGCGRPIKWGETSDGKRIPLDPRPAVYRIIGEVPHAWGTTLRVERVTDAHVSHFVTCPKASDFSRGKKESDHA